MRVRLSIAAGFCAIGVLLGQIQEASACSCALEEGILPKSDSVDVPSNTKIWPIGACEAPTLQKADGTDVPLMSAQVAGQKVFEPASPLDVGGSYEIHCITKAATELVSNFTVAAGPDTTPPAAPTVTIGQKNAGGSTSDSCGEYEYTSMLVAHAGDVVVLDVAGKATLDAQSLGGTVVDQFYPGESYHVGGAPCKSLNWDFEANGDAPGVRFAAFDLAGNFSGWSAAMSVPAAAKPPVDTGQDETADGCAYVGGSDTSFTPALALILAGLCNRLRRRR